MLEPVPDPRWFVLEKTGRVKQIRRDIARIKTIQTERRKPTEAAPAAKAEPKTAPAAKTSGVPMNVSTNGGLMMATLIDCIVET